MADWTQASLAAARVAVKHRARKVREYVGPDAHSPQADNLEHAYEVLQEIEHDLFGYKGPSFADGS